MSGRTTTPVRLLHLITELDVGGAETMLWQMARHLDPARFSTSVVALGPEGPIAARLRADRIPVSCLGLRAGWPAPGRVGALWLAVRRARPQIIHAWLYHANLAALMLGPLAGTRRIIWSLHNGRLRHGLASSATIRLSRRMAPLARFASALTSPSASALADHAEDGYRNTRVRVIRNGFDLDVFKPDQEARHAVRAELGLDPDTALIGMPARLDPQKDHPTAIEAARLLAGSGAPSRPDTRLLLYGRGVDQASATLARWMRDDVRGRVVLLGLRSDTARLAAALDVVTLSASGQEALPLAIGEAMACGVPAVATDVGDTAHLVGDTGIVTPPGNPAALAAGWRRLLDLSPDQRRALGGRARQRIAAHFDIRQVAREFQRLYAEVIGLADAP